MLYYDILIISKGLPIAITKFPTVMLYYDILIIEKRLKNFNKSNFSSDDIIELAKSIGINICTDYTIDTAEIIEYNGEIYIFYNPYQPELFKTLILGHELGYYLLGHIHFYSKLKSMGFFSCPENKIEKDAGIIGYLFWEPSFLIEKYKGKKYIEEQLFEEWKYFLDEIKEEEIIEICLARTRIYKDFKRIDENQKIQYY